jgi:hypothetical protein
MPEEANMTPDSDKGQEFTKWLKQWRSEIENHMPMASTHGGKRKHNNDSGPGNDSVSKTKRHQSPTDQGKPAGHEYCEDEGLNEP